MKISLPLKKSLNLYTEAFKFEEDAEKNNHTPGKISKLSE
jgi:hypothetical protein